MHMFIFVDIVEQLKHIQMATSARISFKCMCITFKSSNLSASRNLVSTKINDSAVCFLFPNLTIFVMFFPSCLFPVVKSQG